MYSQAIRKGRIRSILLFCFILCIACSGAYAQLTLPALFSDGMVLQQQAQPAVWGWAKAGSSVSVTTSWNRKKYTAKADRSGKWLVNVATPEAGGPYTVTIAGDKTVTLNNVLIGEVWLCSGQSNMEMPMKGYKGQPILGSNEDILRSKNSRIRMITVPRSSKTDPQQDFEGQWKEAAPENTVTFSATAYYFGRLLNDILEVPVGLVHVSYGGSSAEAWMHEDWLGSFDFKDIPTKDDEIKSRNQSPTVLYNGMLYPVIGYGIKGCIWYQGESNHTRPDQYEALFPAMVREWRKAWGIGEFPFYYAQIAPFDYVEGIAVEVPEKYNSAYLRDAQRKAMDKMPNSGMAVLMDTGEKDNIHPADKKAAGHRLAYWALGQTYGMKGVAYKSPEYDKFEVNGSTIELFFKNAPNGITSFGEEVTAFEIAGAGKRFYPATAIIGRETITLFSRHVKKPVAIRYAFRNFVKGNVFNTEGLPLSSFRTDDW